MSIEVCRPGELGSSDLEAWGRFQASDPRLGSPFLSATFARAVDAVEDRTRVAVVRDGATAVAFLPFTRRWPRVAGELAEGLTTRQAVLHDPALAPFDVAGLLKGARLAAWEFSALVPNVETAPGLRSRPIFSHVVDLSDGYGGYQEWLATDSKRYANWLRRKRQRLESDVGPIRFRSGDADPLAFEQLLRWKSEQYRRSGWHDPLHRRWVVDLLARLDAERAGDLTGCLSTLRVGDALLAADFSLYSRSVYAGWFVAYNPDFAHFSPGAIHFACLVERTAALGLASFDIGPGDEDYKHRMANGRLDLIAGRVERPTGRAMVRRLQKAPARRARQFVLDHPALRAGVRRGLRATGRVRTALGRSGAGRPARGG